MVARLRAWLPLGASLLLAVAGCRTASPSLPTPSLTSARMPARSLTSLPEYTRPAVEPVPEVEEQAEHKSPDKPRSEREEAAGQFLPPLPVVPEPYRPAPGPDGRPLSLAGLRDIARAHNPQIIQASANVEKARAVASQDSAAGNNLQIAEFKLRRAEMDLMTQVRRRYFSVLAAERSFTLARSRATLSSDVYNYQSARLRGGEGASYDPIQSHALAMQASAAMMQAQNRLTVAWRQLTATLGTPETPPTALAGSFDAAVPRFVADDVVQRVLGNHTDMQIAEATHCTSDELEHVRNDLTAQVAAAFQRYDNNRALMLLYRDRIIPERVRDYRSICSRCANVKPEEMNFNEVVTAQQTLADAVRSYIDSIGGLWESVVSIADLLQVDELDVAATGSDSHDHCPVPSFEPPTSRKGEPPAPIAKRTVLPLRIRQIEWTDCRVPFEVWQLRDDKHRIVFNVVPLQ